MIRDKVEVAYFRQLRKLESEKEVLLGHLKKLTAKEPKKKEITAAKRAMKKVDNTEKQELSLPTTCPYCGTTPRDMESHVMKCKSINLDLEDLENQIESEKKEFADNKVAEEKKILTENMIEDSNKTVLALKKEAADLKKQLEEEDDRALEEVDPDYEKVRDEHITIPTLRLKCFDTGCKGRIDTSDENEIRCFWETGLNCPVCKARHMVPNMSSDELDQVKKARRRKTSSQGNVTIL